MTEQLNDNSPHGSRDANDKRRRSPRARKAQSNQADGDKPDDRARRADPKEPPRRRKTAPPPDEGSAAARSTPRSRARKPVPSMEEYLQRRDGVNRVMLIRQKKNLSQVAVLENGRLMEHYADHGAPSMVGNVYLGSVRSVLPSMEAAFVDIGTKRNGILHAGELSWEGTGLKGKARCIENVLKPGDKVVVQVTKDPVAHKGPRLTCGISLAGRYLVYVPEGAVRGVTRKLPDEERSRLKSLATILKGTSGGFIVRTAAAGVAEDDLREDAQELTEQWESLSSMGTQGRKAGLMLSQPSLVTRVVRDVLNESFSEVIISGGEAWEEVSSYLSGHSPHLLQRVRQWELKEDLFDQQGVTAQLATALERKVPLPSGGSLVIDRTEALTVIDVNTGKFTGKGGTHEETVTENNLEAAEEVARQLRLRDIGGIVIIDFIDMSQECNRDLVMRKLGDSLEGDRTRARLAEMTSLGLVQLTRKRTGAGMADTLTAPCSACAGVGYEVDPLLTEGGREDGTKARRRRSQKGEGPHKGKDAAAG